MLDELGIGVTAYGVLSRGLLSGSKPTGPGDYRAWLPRFQGDNLAANLAVAETLHALAAEKGATASQLAIAWVLSRGPRIVPLVGARTRAQLQESLGALELHLTAQDLARLEAQVPEAAIAGTRYDVGHMQSLDSERG